MTFIAGCLEEQVHNFFWARNKIIFVYLEKSPINCSRPIILQSFLHISWYNKMITHCCVLLLFIVPLQVCKDRFACWPDLEEDTSWLWEKAPFLKKTPIGSLIRPITTVRLTRYRRRSADRPHGSVGSASCRSRSRPSAGRWAVGASPRSSTCRLAGWFGPFGRV